MASISAGQVDRDLLSVGDDAQLRERLLDQSRLFAQRLQRAPDLAGRMWFSLSLMRVWTAIKVRRRSRT